MPSDRPLVDTPAAALERLREETARRECAFALVAVRLADRRNLLRCAKCGLEIWTPNTLAFGPCTASPRGPCVHRSPEAVELRDCPTCSGNVRVKLYACPLHKLCTIAKPIDGAACCASCLDFQQAPTFESTLA